MRTRLSVLCAALAAACALAPSAASAAEGASAPSRVSTSDRSPHIAFGTPLTDSSAAPWAALLERQTVDGGFALTCTANVVNATTVLTAAHCVVDEETGQIVPANLYRIQVGGVQPNQPGAQVVQGAGVAVHPLYKGFRDGYDVAVIALAAPLSFATPQVQPIPIVGADKGPRDGTDLTFFGWGTTETGAPKGLQGMTTESISSALCAPGKPAILCAFNRAQAPCGGDSGGGLVRGQAKGKPELVALDSYGGEECKPGQPDGFADLAQPSVNKWLGGVLTGKAVKPKAGPRARKAPRVRRVSRASTRLRCTSARWRGASSVRTVWLYNSGKIISRTSGSYYTAKRRDVGKTISCLTFAKNRNGSAGIASRTGYRFSFIGRV